MEFDVQRFIPGLAEWGEELCMRRNCFLGTVQLEQLDSLNGPIAMQVREAVSNVCSLLIQQSESRPHSPSRLQYLPTIIAAPDLPVAKHLKPSAATFEVNRGLHWQWFSAHHPDSRVPCLVTHFRDKEDFYKSKVPSLSLLHAKPVTYTPGYLMDYLAKHIKRGNFDIDDIMIFPSHSLDFAKRRIEERQNRRSLVIG
jgi:hypothetical protein